MENIMKKENLILLSREYEQNILSHKNANNHHKIKIEELEKSYRNFYANQANVELERWVCKEFEFCDDESLKIFKKFIGE